jgi:uncharacterized protein YjiK
MTIRTISAPGARICYVFLSTLMAATVFADGGSVLSRYSFDAKSFTQWELPKKLREISGLAMTPDGRLLAQGDELGIVYQIDFDNGGLVKAFALGDPTVRDDFEGIAVQGNVVYLVTSHGKIYRALEGHDGERVEYEVFDTGLWQQCEIEGLAFDTRGQNLLLACKEPHSDALVGVRMIYRWSTQEHRVLESQSIAIDASMVAQRLDTKSFNPSDITLDRTSGHMIFVASHQQALVETDAAGTVVAALRLPLADRHRQPEGLAIAPDGRLIIADEGGKGRARLGVYLPTR